MLYWLVQMMDFLFQKFGINGYILNFIDRHPPHNHIAMIFLWNKRPAFGKIQITTDLNPIIKSNAMRLPSIPLPKAFLAP